MALITHKTDDPVSTEARPGGLVTDAHRETREAWLKRAIDILRPPLAQVGAHLPDDIMVSVGFGSRNVRKTLGVCFPTRAGGGVPHLFITPTLVDPIEVLAVLIHELIHASDDCASKHGGHFRKCAKAIGLEGKMTATVPGDALRRILAEVADELGEYPHKQLSLGQSAVKKQTTRLLKAVCGSLTCPLADETGKTYTVRVTRKWIEVGMPSCPCGTLMEIE